MVKYEELMYVLDGKGMISIQNFNIYKFKYIEEILVETLKTEVILEIDKDNIIVKQTNNNSLMRDFESVFKSYLRTIKIKNLLK